MDVPGISMFAGAGSLHIDRSAQERLDEQEELEDQKRREKELQAKLMTGFDDLVDDDEPSSLNSSHDHTGLDTSAHDPHHDHTGPHPAAHDPHHHPRAPAGGDVAKSRNPPTYVESLNHMKDTGSYDASRPRDGTPSAQRDYGLYAEANEDARVRYSPCGAGDSEENCYYPNEYRAAGHKMVGQHNGVNSYEAKQQMLNFEQLKMMYEMRVKECQQLAEQLESVQAAGETEADALRARLAASLADRDQAQLSLQQAQRLLANSKHQMTELQQEVSEMRERLSRAAADKERVALELHSTALALQDAQQRLQAAQVARTHETDALFREQQDRHREECERLREDLEKTKNRLVEKEQEVHSAERRRAEAERRKEELLVEKGSVVNRLAAELEAAQMRLAGGDAGLQRTQHQLKELGSKLERTAQELVSSRKECACVRQEYDDWRNTLQQIIQDAVPDHLYLGSPSSPGKLSKLKDMLNRYKQQEYQLNKLTDEMNKKDKKLESCRALEGELRRRLEERRGAEEQLAALQGKLDALAGGGGAAEEALESCTLRNRQLEARLLELSGQLKAVELSYAELELQHEQLKADKGSRKSLEREANADLLRELDRLGAQAKDSLRENGELKSLYLQACSARDALARELQDANTKLSSLQKEKDSACEREKTSADQLERERQQTEKLSKELEKARGGLEEANRRMGEQQKEYSDKQKEFADKLQKYIIRDESVTVCRESERCSGCEKQARTIAQLQTQIQQYVIQLETHESNELLLKELRSKAEYFEQYIVQRFRKMQDLRHAATNTEPLAHTNGHGETDRRTDREPDDTQESLATRTDMMMKEKYIREQLAEQYTLEIKTIEMNFTKRMNELQKENAATISKLKELLETKAQEVEVLKKFVLSERTKVNEILQAKEKELAVVLQENRSLKEEFRELREKANELKQMLEKSHTKNLKLKSDLEKRTEELSGERARSARALAELSEQLRALDAKTAHVETQHDQLRDKYRNVKKTALVYKEYASKKDAHVESELDRIKSHYEAEVARLHEKLQRVIKKRREIQVNERISKMQQDFDAMVSEVNSVT